LLAGAVAAQQGLRGGEPEGGAGVGVVSAAQRVQRNAAIVEGEGVLRAGGEALLYSGVEQLWDYAATMYVV
jgi:hypothetical protein